MKKLIAISVIFALVAGAAFAETAVSATAFGLFNAYNGTDISGDDGWVSGGTRRARLEANGSSDDGMFGGQVRYDGGSSAFAWYQPIDELRITIGSNPDGWFGLDGVTRWGFYGLAGDVGIADEKWGWSNSFFGGWGGSGGLMLTLTPIPEVVINVGVPYGKVEEKASDTFKSTNAQFVYSMDGMKFGVTFAGGIGNKLKPSGQLELYELYAKLEEAILGGDPVEIEEAEKALEEAMEGYFEGLVNMAMAPTIGGLAGLVESNGSTIYGYFNLSTIENLSLDVGVGFGLEVKDEDTGLKYQPPIAIGLGAQYTVSDTFGVKARVQALVAAKYDGDKLGNGFEGEVMPYITLSDSMTFYCPVYFGMWIPDSGDNANVFFVNPYVQISNGSGSFFAGLKIARLDDGDEAILTYRVPIGVAFSW